MMIYNELPTAFPWYDKLEKQQRFRENARKACDYRLISPYNGLLPFQFKQEYYTIDSIVPEDSYIDGSYVNSADGTFDSLAPDPAGYVRTDFIPVDPGRTMYIRRGRQIGQGYAFYDIDHVFISGGTPTGTNFNVTAPANAAFVIFNVSNSFPNWSYDKMIFKVVYDEPVPRFTPGVATSWVVRSCCGIEIDLTDNLPFINRRWFEDGIRIYYKGEALTVPSYGGTSKPLDLPPNTYYSVLRFEDGSEYFSEVFTVPDDRFAIGERCRYMRVDFWNTCDISPIMYSDSTGGWRQYTYIDTFIHASEPEVEEDGERDGNDMLIPTFQRMVVRYRFSAAVPDFVKIALVSMQIHDNIFVTTENEVRSGRVERMSTSATIDDNGAYSILDVVLEQNVLVKKSCCSNMDALTP